MDQIVQIMEKMMDVCELRHRVLAGNLANVDTPNYVRKDVQFKDALAQAIRGGTPDAIGEFSPEVVTDRGKPVDANGNNVAAQDELARISENTMLYGLAAKVLNTKFATLRKAINSR